MLEKPEIKPLTKKTLEDAVLYLTARDARLHSVIDAFGMPPLWAREPGFATLVHIILEQQVSLASAKACFDTLRARIGMIEPDSFLDLSDAELLQVGFSRQKTRYCRILAEAVQAGHLDLDGLVSLSDEVVHDQLTALTGIGSWTANIYLLMALGRPDIWPSGDLALVVAIKELYGLESRPSPEVFRDLGERWRPYRAVAARILWHYYLSK